MNIAGHGREKKERSSGRQQHSEERSTFSAPLI